MGQDLDPPTSNEAEAVREAVRFTMREWLGWPDDRRRDGPSTILRPHGFTDYAAADGTPGLLVWVPASTSVTTAEVYGPMVARSARREPSMTAGITPSTCTRVAAAPSSSRLAARASTSWRRRFVSGPTSKTAWAGSSPRWTRWKMRPLVGRPNRAARPMGRSAPRTQPPSSAPPALPPRREGGAGVGRLRWCAPATRPRPMSADRAAHLRRSAGRGRKRSPQRSEAPATRSPLIGAIDSPRRRDRV